MTASELLTDIFDVVLRVVQEFISVLVELFTNITNLFYTNEGGLTFIGVLLLIGLGMSLVYWAFRFIRNLIRR